MDPVQLSPNNMKTSLNKTRMQVSPEKGTSEDNICLTKSVQQITIIQTDKENEGTIEDCTKYSKSKISKSMNDFLESNKVTITMSIVTIYALFADDVKNLGFSKSADDVFSSLVVVCLFLFSLELTLSFFFKPNYKWSFYFWLDLISTLSLITDIGWIWDSLIGVSNSSSSSKKLQNAGKASRAGTRTSRVLRIIRLVRLIRLVKLYKNAQIALKKANDGEDEEIIQEIKVENLDVESKVGKKLSEVTMKRVILIVLIMLFLLPFFDIDFYYSAQTSWVYGVSELDNFLNLPSFDQVLHEYISYHKKDIRPIVYLSWKNDTGDFEWSSSTNYNDLRYNELYYYSYNNFISIFDTRYDSKLVSLLNIFKTLFICIVLTLGALYFTKDAEVLVIRPIEKMIEKVKKIAKNPLAASEIKTLQDTLFEVIPKKTCFCFKSKPVESSQADYETKIIENTIIKIGILLGLGFGEAGSAIIGSNIEKNTEIDSMITGNKIVAIFGFCDIRNFTDTTEELQEGVMMFVNEIAQIIHGVVDKYFGAANKNIGDAFLMVWKFNSDEFFIEGETIVRNPESKKAFYVPDLALLSFLKVLAKVNKDPVILKYRSYAKLLQRMPNYEVKMGFGMHLGWAIEGAIGSQFKIDASYLSPHVNVASALEGSTKLYGVPLLISGPLYDTFSDPIKRYCRQLDVVKIKGMQYPISLYTSDCDFRFFTQSQLVNRKKEVYRKKRKTLRRKLETDRLETLTLFKGSKEVSLMRKEFTEEFYLVFDEGIRAYIKGDWLEAKEKLEKALKIQIKDGPALAIMNYMSEFEYRSPTNWEMCRYLY